MAICLLTTFLCYSDGFAQQILLTQKIYGTVKDSLTHETLGLITIKLKTEKDSLLKTTISKTDGRFSFENIEVLKYHLVLISIGYEAKVVVINLTDDKTTQDIGVIYLSKRSQNLNEVVVKSDRPIIKQKADRIVYDLQADPESKVNNVLGMIHKIPYLSVDANNTVLMKGNSSFKVLINGKPSGMLTNNLTEVLRSMPASSVLRIEVITIPPAKYDAEGMAGIINIITDRKINDGYKGTLNANEGFPPGQDIGGSFTAQQGKFGINSYGGLSSYNSPQANYSNKRVTTDTDATVLNQAGHNQSDSKNGYIGVELSYQIDTLNLLSGNINVNGNRYNGSSTQTSILTNSAGLLQGYDLDNTNNGNRSGIDAAINYQLGFRSMKNTLLTFSYEYSYFRSNAYNDEVINDPFNFTTPDYMQTDKEQSNEHTIQVDYTHPIGKVNMETGVKAILRNSNSNSGYNSIDSASNLFESVPAFGNVFRYIQDVFGIYNSYQFSLKKWNFSAGLRAEETYVDASFVSTGTNTIQNYFNVVPSIAINKSFDDNSSLSFGFAQRIRRPSIYRLNPFVNRSDPDFISSGNPNLQPVVMNNLQLGYSSGGGKKVSVFLGADETFFNNLELPVTNVNPVSQVTTTTYQNAGKGGGAGLNFNVNYSPAKVYNLSINGDIMQYFIKGTGDIATDKMDMLAGHVSLSNSFKFNEGWSSNLNFDFYSKQPRSIQVTANAFATSSLSVNKELIKNKLFLSAAVNNPFTKFRNSITETTGDDFIQTNDNQVYFRSFRCSINYNFGRLKSDIKKNRKGINNDDVSNGGEL